MRISDRYVDYGVVGAFFLIGQFTLLVIWGLTGLITNGLEALVRIIPSQLQVPTYSLLTILGVIGIFFFGLLLDLFSLIPAFPEKYIFKMRLDDNQDWLDSLRHQDSYFQKGYDGFLAAGRLKKMWKRIVLRTEPPVADPTLKSRSVSYYRLRYFLYSFVILNAGPSQLDALTDQMHVWRTSRAIFTATVIWFIESIVIILIWFFNRNMLPFFQPNVTFFLMWLVLPVLIVITLMMASSAYSRLCATLFSLAYFTSKKNIS